MTLEAGDLHGVAADPSEEELDLIMAAIDGQLDEIDRLQGHRG